MCPLVQNKTSILVVVPVYNHAATLRRLVEDILRIHPHVLVVDDGSTDIPQLKSHTPQNPIKNKEHPLNGLPVYFLRHEKNKGKGAAILSAAKKAEELGMSHIISIDADGQHKAEDLPSFIDKIQKEPYTLFIGCRDFTVKNVPFSSRFGRGFSNFWYKVQTSEKIKDSQSGFRAYPLIILKAVKCREKRYSFETEIIVRASWAGFKVKDIAISVYYAPGKERISHFLPLRDNIRISLLNTRLTLRAIMPVPFKKYYQDSAGEISVLRPMQSLAVLLSENTTALNLALAGFLGFLIGALPLIGLHSIIIILLAGFLGLNKIAALATSQLCIPPFVPALCIELGYYLQKGEFLREISLQTLGFEAIDRIVDWFLGSLILGPVLGFFIAVLVYVLARMVQFGLKDKSKAKELWSLKEIESDEENKADDYNTKIDHEDFSLGPEDKKHA